MIATLADVEQHALVEVLLDGEWRRCKVAWQFNDNAHAEVRFSLGIDVLDGDRELFGRHTCLRGDTPAREVR